MRNFLLILTSILALNSVAAASDVVSGELGNWAVEDSLIQTQYIDEVLHLTVDHQGILDSIAALSEAQGRTVAEGITNVFALYDTLLAATAGGEDPTDSGDQTCGCENPSYELQGPCQGYGFAWYGTCDEFQSCGDSLTYNNYKYPTVEIGNDCWFAENLRSGTDSAGDTIPSGLSDTDWENTTEPAFTILDEGGANEEANLEAYGLLYNWYAVTEGLCPSGWHVATADEYQAIIDANGGSTVAGEAMKASDTDDPTWNGTNTTGFDAVAGGRRQPDGSFGTLNAFIWTSDNGGDNATHLRLKHSTNDADIIQKSKAHGMSVRCVQDTD